MPDLQRPIGYWLKLLDGLIEGTFDRTLAPERLERRHWQLLNTLSHAPHNRTALARMLQPFLTEGAISLDTVIGDLERREWIARGPDGTYHVTAAGEAAHARLAARVQAMRRQILNGLTTDEYQATVHTLRRMAENLQTAVGCSGDRDSLRVRVP